MTNEYIERDCTIEHEGQTFTANGALVNDAYLIAYPSDEVTNHGYALKDWHGNIIGTWRKVSSRPAIFFGHRSWQGSTWCYMRARLTDGREYALRGFGVGMIAKGKRIHGKRKSFHCQTCDNPVSRTQYYRAKGLCRDCENAIQ